MKLVRSDSPEVVHSIASAGTLAVWNWPGLSLGCVANVLVMLIALSLSLTISVRTAAWLSIPVFLALNGYVVWRAVSARYQWLIAGCAEQVYIRLFAWLRKDRGDVNEPDVIVLEASEIASMSVKTLEVFLDGSKPKIVEWLVIQPAQAVADDVSKHIRPLRKPLDPDRAVNVENEGVCFTIGWKWWRLARRVFLNK